jgi:endonuclease/exonuclease/phosphatase family metal-dependent hydrolase
MRRFILIALFVITLPGAAAYGVQANGAAVETRVADAWTVSRGDTGDPVLKVLSLNVAHGRKDAWSQIFVSKKQIRRNLTEIADLLRRHNADVVALQEADGPSGWSGGFDHVAFIAEHAGYPWHYRAAHVTNWFSTYGTALLSRLPMSEIKEHTFAPSPPTFNKGFLMGRLRLPLGSGENREASIDIVSVHLDFSRRRVRQQQIREMTRELEGRGSPLIILGDFNSEWLADESVVRRLAEDTRMKVYTPDAPDLQSYPKRGTRLDWILVTKNLDFVSYAVLPDIVSDHRAVVATIRLSSPFPTPAKERTNDSQEHPY